MEMFRSSTRWSKCAHKFLGKLWRRMRGMLFAVEAAGQLFFQAPFFGRVFAVHHLLREDGEFVAGELAAAGEVHGETNDFGLRIAGKEFDLFDDSSCGHALILSKMIAETSG